MNTFAGESSAAPRSVFRALWAREFRAAQINRYLQVFCALALSGGATAVLFSEDAQATGFFLQIALYFVSLFALLAGVSSALAEREEWPLLFAQPLARGTFVIGKFCDLTLKDMETRLANWLLKRCPQPLPTGPTIIQLDRTKRVLAAEMGTTSETLSRSLAKFRDQKLLRVSEKTITLTKPRELQSLLQRNLGET